MNIAELVERQRVQWRELDQLCDRLQSHRRRLSAAEMTRFAALYRSACADLALADAYQLPQGSVLYLHRLVGRAHNQLYRSRRFHLEDWSRILFQETPQRVFQDACVQLCFVLFWALFLLSAVLARAEATWPNYAESMLTTEGMNSLRENFQHPVNGRNPAINYHMAAFYIWHNTGIGLKAFVGGLLIIPGLFITVFNSLMLGASFGYMARDSVPQGANFFQFVTAHGPFELTAIVLSAGAGLKLGLAWLWTNGRTRSESLRRTAQDALPIMGAAIGLFFLAALLEGFLSPSGAPYAVKALAAVVSCGLLVFYFLMLGYPRRDQETSDAVG